MVESASMSWSFPIKYLNEGTCGRSNDEYYLESFISPENAYDEQIPCTKCEDYETMPSSFQKLKL